MSCSTSPKQMIAPKPAEKPQFQLDISTDANSNREPSVAATDYMGEIEAAHSPVGLVAGASLGDAQARMQKIFDFARHSERPFFAQLRRHRPIFLSQGGQGSIPTQGKISIPNSYVVTQNKDVQEVLAQHSIFSVRPYARIVDPTVGQAYMLGRENDPANLEKPGMRDSLYGHNDLQRVRTIVRNLAQRAIKAGVKDGHLDVAKDVSRAVPLGLNDEYFGFNGPTPEVMARWSRATQYAFFHNSFQDKKVIQASLQAGAEMREYLKNVLLPERAQELANGRAPMDTVSQILMASQAHAQYGLKADRIASNVMGLLVGSVETTAAAINQSLQFIMQHPEIFALAKKAAQDGNDALLSKIVWEALRFDPVNPWLVRYSEQDYVLGRGTDHETLIKKGSLVLASTASAMFDESVFPNPDQFRLDRDSSQYMHLGYGYHRCLGDDVSLVMVPETVRQILLLPGLRPGKPIDQKGGPFPESFVVAFDQPTVASENLVEQGNLGVKQVLGEMNLAGFIATRILEMDQRDEVVVAIADALGKNEIKRRKALAVLPVYVAEAMKNFTAAEKIDACMTTNPKSKEVFTDLNDRKNYCAVRIDFRGCYFVQRLLARQSSYASFNYCAYNRQFLSKDEITDFKQKFAHLDMFYFLNF